MAHTRILSDRYHINLVEQKYRYAHTDPHFSHSGSLYEQSYVTVEAMYSVEISEFGLKRLINDSEQIEREEYLRANNPTLQKAYDKYKTLLALVDGK